MTDNLSNRQIIDIGTQEAPVNLDSIAYKLGVKIDRVNLGDELSGKIECNNVDNSCVISVNSLHHIHRQRFTLAHEIAHFVLHREFIGDGIKEHALLRQNDGKNYGLEIKYEREANFMAAEILMPEPLVRKHFNINLAIENFAAIFKVSTAVAEIRLKYLKLL